MSKKEVVSLSEKSPVTDAIKVLNEKIKEMKHIQETVYVTPGKITTGTGTMLDIKTETNVDTLVRAFSGVQARIAAVEKAYETLGITSYPVVKIDGGTLEEWIKDVKLRIDVINQKDRLEELQGMKKEWEALMDKEDRKAALIEKMATLVS